MIVRNEAAMLADALRTVVKVVNEIVVVDTGSTDNTPDIARAVGARVYFFPWCDSFAAARNESLRRARSDWIFVMDADDRLLPIGAEAIRRGIKLTSFHGYAFLMEEVDLSGRVLAQEISSARLFRNHPDLRYYGRIHEEVRWKGDRRAGNWSGLGPTLTPCIRHYGNDPTIMQAREKDARNMRLIGLQLAEEPDDPHTLCLLVRQHMAGGRPREAAMARTRCLLADQRTPSLMPAELDYLRKLDTRLGVAQPALPLRLS